jgi:hypothetical protein
MSGVTYPRLRITIRPVPVMVQLSATHRDVEVRPKWAVVMVRQPGQDILLYIGRDNSVYGWVDCVDFAHATIKEARSSQ